MKNNPLYTHIVAGLCLYLLISPVKVCNRTDIAITIFVLFYGCMGVLIKKILPHQAIEKRLLFLLPLCISETILAILHPQNYWISFPYLALFSILAFLLGLYFRINKVISWGMILALGAAIYTIAFFLVPHTDLNNRISRPELLYLDRTLPLIDIKTGDTVYLKRGKIYYLEFIHTQCADCLEKMKVSEQLYHHFASDSNIRVISIYNGKKDSVMSSLQFLKGYDMKILYDPKGAFCSDLHIDTYPNAAIVHTDAKVSYLFDGYNGDMKKVYFASIIRKLEIALKKSR